VHRRLLDLAKKQEINKVVKVWLKQWTRRAMNCRVLSVAYLL
jgi:hypothetical protein